MPRKPRFYLPGISVHIVQRGHSRQPVFFENNDYAAYLNWLGEAAERYSCAIHAYVLMTNHIHILATTETKNSISLMIQYTGRRYVPYINHTYGSSGSIWEGRYKASLIHDEEYLLTCMRYIELNQFGHIWLKPPAATDGAVTVRTAKVRITSLLNRIRCIRHLVVANRNVLRPI